MHEINKHLIQKAIQVKKASRELARLNTGLKDRALEMIADRIGK